MAGSRDESPLRGSLSTEVLPYDGGRTVTVYQPPVRATAIVHAADGQVTAQWARALEATAAPPVAIVGVQASADETRRLHEYSPGFDPDLFAAHERFFVDATREWVASHHGLSSPPERTIVLGASAGGELALALGLRRPDVFGTVFCASPGAGFRPPSPLPDRLPAVYLLAGSREPFFAENAAVWADALGAAGADVVMTEREGGHGDRFWFDELPRMLAWALAD